MRLLGSCHFELTFILLLFGLPPSPLLRLFYFQQHTLEICAALRYWICMASDARGSDRSCSTQPLSSSWEKALINSVMPEETPLPFVGSSTPNEDGDILHITAANIAAREAFHELALEYKELAPAHAASLVRTSLKPSPPEEGRDSSSSESEDVQQGLTSTKSKPSIHQGYWRVTIAKPSEKKGTNWSLGKGNSRFKEGRGVDLLLASPRRAKEAGIAAAHALISIHTRSGAWKLRAGLQCKHLPSNDTAQKDGGVDAGCPHAPVVCDGRPLRHAEEMCLTRPNFNLQIGKLAFIVRFCIDTEEKERNFIKDRNLWLAEQGITLTDPQVSGIPFASDIKTQWAVFRRGIGSGTFGVVYDGFEPVSGEPRAVKRLTLKSEDHLREVRDELDALEAFNADPRSEGIVHLYNWCNAHGEQKLTTSLPFEAFIIMEKGMRFSKVDWNTPAPPTAAAAAAAVNAASSHNLLDIFRQLLTGLARIHHQGWLHRDITPSNILYVPPSSTDPPNPGRAVLCDFGKAVHSKKATETNLAAWMFLPPEVQYGKLYAYSDKLDVWMLGYALVRSWRSQNTRHLSSRRQMTVREHGELMECLKPSPITEKESQLWQVLADMMAWNPKRRPSATEALDWVDQVISSNRESEAEKRQKRS